MRKHYLPVALGSLLLLGACHNNDFQTTKDGLQYKIVKDEKGGQSPKVGDIIKMNFVIRYKDDSTKLDTVLVSSSKINGGQPLETQLPPPAFGQDWTKGLAMLTPGDSAIFRMPVDSLRKTQNGPSMPDFMRKGQYVTVEVSLLSVRTQVQVMDSVKKSMKEHAAQQGPVDDKIIQEYLAKNNLKAQQTPSGLYYIMDKQGSGPMPHDGQEVSMNYTGKTLDGKSFDSNLDPAFKHVEPLKFTLGEGGLIPGWVEAARMMNKGAKMRVYIPSALAYGQAGREPKIAPNTVLMFDLEVTDIEDAPKAQVQNLPAHK